MVKFRQFGFTLLLFLSLGLPSKSAVEVEAVLQSGHYDAISSVDISANGQFLATASYDNTLKIWEMSTGRELRTFIGHTKAVLSVKFSPGGTQLLSVGAEHKAVLWDILSGKVVREWTDSTDEIRSASFSPKGTYIVTGGHKTNAILWKASDGSRLYTFKTKPEVCYQCASSLTFSPDEKILYTSSGDRTTLAWSIAKRDTIKSWKLAKGSCSSCNAYQVINSSGSILLKADYGGALYVIDLTTNKVINTIEEDVDFYGIQLHPNGKFAMAVVDYRGKVKVWDLSSGEVIQEIKEEKGIKSAVFSPDGKYIVTAGEDLTAKLWNVGKDAKAIRLFEGKTTRINEEGLNPSELHYINLLKDTELSPDGEFVAQCKRGNAALIWDLRNGRIVQKLMGHKAVVTCVSFSPDGQLLATGSADRSIKIWKVATGELQQTISAHGALLLTVKFSVDGQQLISGSWDGYFKVWELKTGEMLAAAKVHEGSPYAAALSKNGLYALTSGLDRTVKCTELDSRTVVHNYIGHTAIVHSLAISDDGERMLSSGGDGFVKQWKVSTAWQVSKMVGHLGPVYYAAYDHSGKYILSGGRDKTAKVWSAEDGRLIRTFSGHQGAVNYVSSTPDGKLLLTAAQDGTVKIWDMQTGKERITHITLNENDWLAKTADGHFEGTTAATKSLFFVKGLQSYALDQFFEQFYQPGLHQQTLSVQSRSTEEIHLSSLLERSPPPGIELLSPQKIDTSIKGQQEIILKVTNTGGGINEIGMLHNGKRIDLPNRLSRTPKTGQDMILTYSVSLVPGDNEISISGWSDERVESSHNSFQVHYEGTAKNARLFILAIGINAYKNPALALNYARPDAESFSKSIAQKSKKLYRKVETVLLLDEEATKQNILNQLEAWKTEITKEDVFYFYYAGHGGTHEQEFYFIPTESVSLYQGDKLNEQAISATMLNEKLRKIAALKQVVVLDACHAGASTQVLASRGLMEEKALAQLARSSGIHIMAAAGSEQQAVEFGQLGHGVFTFALLEALEGKADGAPADQKVTIYELKSYLDDQVPELTKKYQGRAQYPNTFSLGQDFPMVFSE
jgi:WD40 repeat protein